MGKFIRRVTELRTEIPRWVRGTNDRAKLSAACCLRAVCVRKRRMQSDDHHRLLRVLLQECIQRVPNPDLRAMRGRSTHHLRKRCAPAAMNPCESGLPSRSTFAGIRREPGECLYIPSRSSERSDSGSLSGPHGRAAPLVSPEASGCTAFGIHEVDLIDAVSVAPQILNEPHLFGHVEAKTPKVNDVATRARRRRLLDQHRLEPVMLKPTREAGPGDSSP
jgi:hypothetical protein